MADDKPVITPEQKASLEAETQAALQTLADKAKADAVAQIKAETRKEVEAEQKLKEQADLLAKMQAELEAQKKAQEAKEAEYKKRIDELAGSKAPIRHEDPFRTQMPNPILQSQGVSAFESLKANPELYREVEKKAKEAFFSQ